jgi:TatA/E family protein of Tat protein translocase
MSIGPTEIIVVLVIALLVFGPGRLPQMGRSLGRGVREFKRAADTAKEELGLSEVIDNVNEVKDSVLSAAGVDDIKASIADVTSTIDDAKQSAGLGEIAAGVGSVKTVMAFDPRKAAKDLVTGGKKASSDTTAETTEADENGAGAREADAPAAESEPQTVDETPVAVEGEAPATAEDEAPAAAGDVLVAAATQPAVEA